MLLKQACICCVEDKSPVWAADAVMVLRRPETDGDYSENVPLCWQHLADFYVTGAFKKFAAELYRLRPDGGCYG